MGNKVRTPLRYPGGKSRVLEKILPRLPEDFCEYREPFLGGGSVFIAVKQQNPDATYWINDLNFDLYCFWIKVRDSVKDLLEEVLRVKNAHEDGRKLYKKLQESDYRKDEFFRAVRFTLLNRISYSGTGDSGGYSSQAFNRGIPLEYILNLERLSTLLAGVKITNHSYEKLLFEKGKKVAIFLDPPYWRSTKQSAMLYGINGNLHSSFNHSRFAENMKKCKHKWLITYGDSEVIRRLFRFASRYTVQWEMFYGMKNVNSKKQGRGKELFISNYPTETKAKRNQKRLNPVLE